MRIINIFSFHVTLVMFCNAIQRMEQSDLKIKTVAHGKHLKHIIESKNY